MAMKRLKRSEIRKCKPRNKSNLSNTEFEKSEIKLPRREQRGKQGLKKKSGLSSPENCWKPVPVNYGIDFDGFGGIEELTDYKAVLGKRKWKVDNDRTNDNAQNSKFKKPKKIKIQRKDTLKPDVSNDFSLNQAKGFRLVNSPEFIKKVQNKRRLKKISEGIVSENNSNLAKNGCYKTTDKSDVLEETDIDMSRWSDLFVPATVLQALKELNFTAPTPIQAYTLPSAIRDRMDILGAAETGSGKTLAFAIPIIHGILIDKEKECTTLNSTEQIDRDTSNQYGDGMFIDEDVEIAEEEDDDQAVDKFNDKWDESFDKESIIESSEIDDNNDMESENSDCEKESNKSNEKLDIEELDGHNKPSEKYGNTKPLRCLILTPTRELAIQIQKHIQAISIYSNIRVAVVVGGMASEKQIRVLKKGPEIVVATPGRLWELIQEGNDHLNKVANAKYLVIDEADRMVEKGHFEELKKVLDLMRNNKDQRQNFIFSATLTMVHDTPKRLLLKKKKYKLTQKIKLDSIMQLIGMKDKPKVIDITKQFGTADSLTEAKLFCNVEDKDSYLYYFCLTYPGRTLVFCNSIDCVRRLKNVFQFLNCNPLPLHSSMAQRQRLKNLDRFRNKEKSLLLATDVAARGLDIQNVQHVIHYQIPKAAEIYVHRSGRTARALNEGLSLMLLSPQEVTLYRKLCRTLNREKDLPDFPVNQMVFSSVQERVALARSLDVLSHRFLKKSSQSGWLLQAAERMDIDIEDQDLQCEVKESLEQNKKDSNTIKYMKKQLDSLLKNPVAPRGMFTKYPTQTGKLNIHTITSSNSAIAAVGKQIPWSNYEEKTDTKLALKKPKKNKKKYWKPSSKTK